MFNSRTVEKINNDDNMSISRTAKTNKTNNSEKMSDSTIIRPIKSVSATLITRPKYDFKNHKECFKNKEYCFFCLRKFKFGRSRHHCRLCTNSVCDDCSNSNNNLQGNRICDICFSKHSNKDVELEKKAYIKNLAKFAVELEQKTANIKKTVGSKEIEKITVMNEIEHVNEKNIRKIEELRKNIADIQFIYESKITEQNAKEEGIKKRTEICNESSRRINSLENEVSMLTISNDMTTNTFFGKKKRREELIQHYNEMIRLRDEILCGRNNHGGSDNPNKNSGKTGVKKNYEENKQK